MKTLLLPLLLGLACAQLNTVDELCFQLSGEWKTIYMTSTNPEKLSETGPFRAFVRKFEFDVEHDTMTVNFFLKVNGECVEYSVKGPKVQENRYTTNCKYDCVTLNSTLVRSNGQFLFYALWFSGRGNDVNAEDFETFKGLNREKNIPEESMVKIISFDTCPTSE
uniref:Lipocalin/cytosolic fatty-acid binding domain-containing protein n=1 Tax=Rhinolophus ferrumequinum TaxID=59479 RepID=A0A671E258_RHIFE